MNYGRYQITKEVGRGSMGLVYEAHDPQINRIVAVKVLRQDHMGTEAFVTRFLKEAKVVGRLSHPNIVAIYDVGEEQGAVYIAMEFLHGTSLADIVKGTPQEAGDVVAYCVQIAEALDYAHQKGVVHRDIKPSNIVVQPDGCIKITDFGIAHIDDSSATLQTQAGEILGTPAYMSPEQVLGKPVDGRSDIFSLGVILYELCTGKRAFGGKDKNLATLFNEIITVTPEEPCVVTSLVPGKLSEIVMKAMQKEPANRFQTGKELADALRSALAAAPESEVRKPAAGKKNRLSFALLAAMGVIMAVCAFLYFSPSATSKPPLPKPSAPALTPSTGASVAKSPQQKSVEPPQNQPSPGAAQEQPRSNQSQEIEQQNQRLQSEKLPPATGFVALKIRTVPQGARLSVDGDSKGTTPLTLQLPRGTHLLRMTMTGYKPLDKQITIEETMEYPLTFDLQKVVKKD